MENDPTIDLWCVFLDRTSDPALDAACRRALAPEEIERERRFVHEQSRRQFLIGRALLRTVLARYTACDPRALRFERNPHGKPRLATPTNPPLEFSLSHAPGLTICAVTWRDPVGVDVERDYKISDPEGFARKFFSPDDAMRLARLPAKPQNAELLRLWTLKEALAKAQGTGLSGDITHTSQRSVPMFGTEDAAGKQATADAMQGDWQCISMRLASRFHLALVVGRPASEKSPIRVRVCRK
jgi:4'-phosphopantetheinyl transferase